MRKSAFSILLLSIFSIHYSYSQDDKTDKNAESVKAVIEKEVDALNRDYNLEEYLSCFLNSDRVQAGPSDNKMTIGYAALKANAEKVIQNYNGQPNPNTWSFSGWDIRVNGNTAFASCVETAKTPRGTYIDV